MCIIVSQCTNTTVCTPVCHSHQVMYCSVQIPFLNIHTRLKVVEYCVIILASYVERSCYF